MLNPRFAALLKHAWPRGKVSPGPAWLAVLLRYGSSTASIAAALLRELRQQRGIVNFAYCACEMSNAA